MRTIPNPAIWPTVVERTFASILTVAKGEAIGQFSLERASSLTIPSRVMLRRIGNSSALAAVSEPRAVGSSSRGHTWICGCETGTPPFTRCCRGRSRPTHKTS
jgi:hypothetical protein